MTRVRVRPMTCKVRKIEGRDQRRWRELFEAYTRFYEREPSDAITGQAWARIMDATIPIYAIVAAGEDQDDVIGIAHYVIHESTSKRTPVCYLQDLFVDPGKRGVGVGRLLIDWLVAEMAAAGWSRLYWHTRENNYRARRLYDKYAPHSGFVRYVIVNPRA
jgi:GNAT superfamily N-acetyltransferase